MTSRAQEIHNQSDEPAKLESRAKELTAQAQATTQAVQKSNLTALSQQASEAKKVVDQLPKTPNNKSDLEHAAKTLEVVGRAGSTLADVLSGNTQPLQKLAPNVVGSLVGQRLPSVTPAQIKKGLTVASRLISLVKDPNAKKVLGVMQAVRGAKAGRSGTTTDYLLSAVVGAASGQPFDPVRFLSGAMIQASKDLKARATQLRDEEQL